MISISHTLMIETSKLHLNLSSIQKSLICCMNQIMLNEKSLFEEKHFLTFLFLLRVLSCIDPFRRERNNGKDS